VTKKETSHWEKDQRRWWGARRSHDVVKKGRRQNSMTRRYRSWFQDLINVWTMQATMLKN